MQPVVEMRLININKSFASYFYIKPNKGTPSSTRRETKSVQKLLQGQGGWSTRKVRSEYCCLIFSLWAPWRLWAGRSHPSIVRGQPLSCRLKVRLWTHCILFASAAKVNDTHVRVFFLLPIVFQPASKWAWRVIDENLHWQRSSVLLMARAC